MSTVNTPTPLMTTDTVAGLALGENNTCYIRGSDFAVECRGANDANLVPGAPVTLPGWVFVPELGSGTVSEIYMAGHADHYGVVTNSGDAFTWGANGSGQLGIGATGGAPRDPTLVGDL